MRDKRGKRDVTSTCRKAGGLPCRLAGRRACTGVPRKAITRGKDEHATQVKVKGQKEKLFFLPVVVTPCMR